MRLESSPNRGAIVHHKSESYLVFEMKSKQQIDLALMKLKESVLGKLNKSFSLEGDGMLRCLGRLCYPDVYGLRDRILEEAHGSCYSIHQGSTKMYHDLRDIYWWECLKRDIVEIVAKCPNGQQVKAEHIKSGGLLQEIHIPTWKWEYINMDFVVGLPRT